MPIKATIGLSKKVGQPDYGSLGASCHIEVELDGGFDNGSTQHFQDAMRRAYAACRQAVEAELKSSQVAVGPGGQHQSPGTTDSNSSSRNNARLATSSQVRAIHAIANRNQVDLTGLLGSRFGVTRPDDLGIRDASKLIDQLKSEANGTAAR